MVSSPTKLLFNTPPLPGFFNTNFPAASLSTPLKYASLLANILHSAIHVKFLQASSAFSHLFFLRSTPFKSCSSNNSSTLDLPC